MLLLELHLVGVIGFFRHVQWLSYTLPTYKLSYSYLNRKSNIMGNMEPGFEPDQVFKPVQANM